jgi:hypothetical protein
MSPAGAAILWHVLVLVLGQVVLAVHVSPVDTFRILRDDIPCVWNCLQLSTDEIFVESTVVLLFLFLFIWNNVSKVVAFVDRLWEGIDCLIVPGVILLVYRSNVPFLVCPGVNGSRPMTITLNGEIVHTSANTEEALLSPVRAP